MDVSDVVDRINRHVSVVEGVCCSVVKSFVTLDVDKL